MPRSSGLGILFLLAACAGQGNVPKDLRVLENEAQLKRAARELDRRLIGVRTWKAVGQLTGSWMGREGSYQVVCAVRWPHDLRLDLLDPAVGTVAQLTVTHGELQWYLPQEERLYRAAATTHALRRATQLPWTPAELTGLLTGLPPMEYGDRFVEWWLGPDGFAVSPDERAVMAFPKGGQLPERYVRYRDAERKRVEVVVRFDDYRPVKGYQLPRALRIEIAHPKSVMTLTYDAVEVNAPLPPDAFTLAIPETTQVVPFR